MTKEEFIKKWSVFGLGNAMLSDLESLEPSRTEAEQVKRHAIRTNFCLWYYAQSQPLDAHKVVDWFVSNLR